MSDLYELLFFFLLGGICGTLGSAFLWMYVAKTQRVRRTPRRIWKPIRGMMWWKP
jgi:H+/Cl- antiporter ClcA